MDSRALTSSARQADSGYRASVTDRNAMSSRRQGSPTLSTSLMPNAVSSSGACVMRDAR